MQDRIYLQFLLATFEQNHSVRCSDKALLIIPKSSRETKGSEIRDRAFWIRLLVAVSTTKQG